MEVLEVRMYTTERRRKLLQVIKKEEPDLYRGLMDFLDWLVTYTLGWDAIFVVKTVLPQWKITKIVGCELAGYGLVCNERCPEKLLDVVSVSVEMTGVRGYEFEIDADIHREIDISRLVDVYLDSYAMNISYMFEQDWPYPLDGEIITMIESDISEKMARKEEWSVRHLPFDDVLKTFLEVPESFYDDVVARTFLNWFSELR